MSCIFQAEMEIGFQMNQLAGTGCIWSLFRDFAAEFLDGFTDVVSYKSLFFFVLFAPFGGHNFSLHGHSSCQCYCVPVFFVTAEDNFRCTAYPRTGGRGVT